LAGCTPISVINAVLNAASMGLEIRNNQAYLIPYGQECQLVIDYRGKIELAKRSGFVDDMEARLVYAGDHLVIKHGLDPQFEHTPLFCRRCGDSWEPVPNEERGPVVLGYAMAWLKGVSRPHIEVMSLDDINRVFHNSKGAWDRHGKAKLDSAWHTDWDQMARKTLIHRECNYIPQSRELARSQDIDDANETGVTIEPFLDVIDEAEERPLIETTPEERDRVLQERLAATKPPDTLITRSANSKHKPKNGVPVLDELPAVGTVIDGQKVYVGETLYRYADERSAWERVT
jgi:recombination protein RecT